MFIVACSCAKVGSPTGGPKDTDPPEVKETKPLNKSTLDEQPKEIVIEFDEFIKLENATNQVYISPPLEEKITTIVKGKKVVVEIPKEIELDSATYTIKFGNAIKDNNEGNILENYEFVFSLKDYLDSMNVAGKVLKASDLKPHEESMYVMLYADKADSIPLKEKPSYISKTDNSGHYLISNVATGTYRLFALKDLNSNMIYDLQDESIAFHDTLITLHPDLFVEEEVIIDTNNLELSDSVVVDSIEIDSTAKRMVFNYELRSFEKDFRNQYITNNDRPTKEKLILTFNEALTDSFKMEPLFDTLGINPWVYKKYSHMLDTLEMWIADSNIYNQEELSYSVFYLAKDSLDNMVMLNDTIKFTYSIEEEKGEVQGLNINKNVESILELNDTLSLMFATPVFDILEDSVQLYKQIDTIRKAVEFKIITVPSSFLRYNVLFDVDPATSYSMIIKDSVIHDIYGKYNDSTTINFTSREDDYYGNLIVSLKGVNKPAILQLLTEKENLLEEKAIVGGEKVTFSYLSPSKYWLKLIIDENNNGKWDPGNYLEGRQPEKVFYYKKEIQIRSNWDFDTIWDLSEDEEPISTR